MNKSIVTHNIQVVSIYISMRHYFTIIYYSVCRLCYPQDITLLLLPLYHSTCLYTTFSHNDDTLSSKRLSASRMVISNNNYPWLHPTTTSILKTANVTPTKGTTESIEATHFKRFNRRRNFIAFCENVKSLADTLVPCLRHL